MTRSEAHSRFICGWGWLLSGLVILGLFLSPVKTARADDGCPSNHQPNGNGGGCVCPPNTTDDGNPNETCHSNRPPPCPDGTIDIQGNGQNDGGDDCQPWRHITTPSWCTPTPVDFNGNVKCILPQNAGGGLGWDGTYVQAAMGCLLIDRTPYPRALVNYPQRPDQVGGDTGVKFALHDDGLSLASDMAAWIPPADLIGLAPGQSGWYQPATDVAINVGNRSDAVRGVELGEDTAGFDSRNILRAHGLWTGTRQNFDIQNVKAFLAFVRDEAPDALHWDFSPNNLPFLSGIGSNVFFRFPRASFPAPINGDLAPDGIDLNGGATLPAFKLVVRSQWDLWYFASWDTYYVAGNEAHRLGTDSVAL